MIEINGIVRGGEENFPNCCKILTSLCSLKLMRH